ncbi:DUF928 domain-containing protein [Leptolyngbya sp. FACHB-261]|uniref:DUF928 domain-containing protein n=1 Tax=Leptolyngbya sp. FACHB-261 TaxID=2692806 RepID=UPI001687765F|nr:DUF928 domain-containing protein [Leptolyngbya sp. FACHB-261]MBD2102467.1 DUF928 domain-containing protein [Leptolyngbya sp. FACHB-261]
MMRPPRFLKTQSVTKTLKTLATGKALVAGLVLTTSLLLPTLAIAGDDSDYLPDTSRSGGSRGCSTRTSPSAESSAALILLTPQQTLGQTISTRPTFAWFVRDAGSWPMEFRLYEHDLSNDQFKLVKEIKDESFKSAPGITVLSLSQSVPELTPGKRYRWQVELVCNASRPSGNPFAEAELEVISPRSELRTSLAGARDRLNRATLYDQANLWYDALGLALTANSDTQLRAFRASLLDKVALGAAERSELQGSTVHQVQR